MSRYITYENLTLDPITTTNYTIPGLAQVVVYEDINELDVLVGVGLAKSVNGERVVHLVEYNPTTGRLCGNNLEFGQPLTVSQVEGIRPVYVGQWAGRPTTGLAVGARAVITDVGINNYSEWRWGGTHWTPVNGSVRLASWTMPMCIASSGSVGTNGAITLNTGTPQNYSISGGVWLYLPTGAAFTNSASGWYFADMSTSTDGVLYNNTLQPNAYTNAPPAILNAIVGAGPGAFVGVTSEITAFSYNIKGGTLSPNGRILVQYQGNNTTSASAKTFMSRLGGVTWTTLANTTSLGTRNSLTAWMMGNTVTMGRHTNLQDGVNTGLAFSIASVDTTVDFPIAITLQSAAVTDTIALNLTSLELMQ